MRGRQSVRDHFTQPRRLERAARGSRGGCRRRARLVPFCLRRVCCSSCCCCYRRCADCVWRRWTRGATGSAISSDGGGGGIRRRPSSPFACQAWISPSCWCCFCFCCSSRVATAQEENPCVASHDRFGGGGDGDDDDGCVCFAPEQARFGGGDGGDDDGCVCFAPEQACTPNGASRDTTARCGRRQKGG